MDHSEEVIGDPAGTVVPQELLEEMVWFFRVEDGSPWNYSILALAAVVVVISLTLLGRSIQANRNRKMQPQEKDTSEVLHLDESRTKENNSLNNLTEGLLSGNPNSAQVGTELKEKDASMVLLPDPPETEGQ
ncbi:Organic solute transporter subunit beta [Sciurus carolinensis]|uniref:Organic solute transporter subunit beta n=1 Tax=Sciurus carolinensis TaxID=30640 RepID=A0AA41ST48_SCICA|nr:organic solute transporter subunit beta [Sciurus carolinensis]MBZ3870902.1 Organic solute transporter subunit beta [Sciurus carolinensis]